MARDNFEVQPSTDNLDVCKELTTKCIEVSAKVGRQIISTELNQSFFSLNPQQQKNYLAWLDTQVELQKRAEIENIMKDIKTGGAIGVISALLLLSFTASPETTLLKFLASIIGFGLSGALTGLSMHNPIHSYRTVKNFACNFDNKTSYIPGAFWKVREVEESETPDILVISSTNQLKIV